MKPGKPLKRKMALKAKKWPKFKKRTKRDWKKIALELWEANGGRCQRCGMKIRLEDVTAANVHHAKKRSAGGKETTEDCRFVCSPMQYYGEEDKSCHTWAELNPAEAKAEGF